MWLFSLVHFPCCICFASTLWVMMMFAWNWLFIHMGWIAVDSIYLNPDVKRHVLTHPHADARSTKGQYAGNLKCAAALWAHQTVPRPQAARRTAASRTFTLCDLVFLGLSLPRVMLLFIPHFTSAFSHDALVGSTKSRYNWMRCDGSNLRTKCKECHIPRSWKFSGRR